MGCRDFLGCFDCAARRISYFTIFFRILSNNGWQKIHEHSFPSFQVFDYPDRSHFRLWFRFVPRQLYNKFRSIVLWHVTLSLQKWHGSLSDILNHKVHHAHKLTNFMMEWCCFKYLGSRQKLLKRWNCRVVGYIYWLPCHHATLLSQGWYKCIFSETTTY